MQAADSEVVHRSRGQTGPVQQGSTFEDQCVDLRVALFFKQVSGLTPKAGGRLLDGRTWDEYPATADVVGL
ncbi:hypothetical protein ACIBJF_51925 [Streptomyces sp. NPDC050743]|uniref:hypothetical protein n=1 Tax=Streptomyces sp. NPDC050743 TaxID=3365634 RepID=UPI0037957B0C